MCVLVRACVGASTLLGAGAYVRGCVGALARTHTRTRALTRAHSRDLSIHSFLLLGAVCVLVCVSLSVCVCVCLRAGASDGTHSAGASGDGTHSTGASDGTHNSGVSGDDW